MAISIPKLQVGTVRELGMAVGFDREQQKETRMNKYLNLGYLKSLNIEPKYFGLGFIQLKLNDVERVHYYHPDLLPIVDEEEIHNHRYDFRSNVLKGYIYNEIFHYKLYPAEPTHILCGVSCLEADSGKAPTVFENVEPVLLSVFGTAEGSWYTLTKDAFHRVTIAAPTVTLVNRGPVETAEAMIIKPVGNVHTCPFSKVLSKEEIWETIDKICEA